VTNAQARWFLPIVACVFACAGCKTGAVQPIAVSGSRFTHDFIPWGFNYDRDYKLRLLEEYWETEWSTVEQDFREMKALGANVVRIHLQFAKFMDAPDRLNKANLARLKRLVRFAEQLNLRLDITGLASYRKRDVPAWYNTPSEQERWQMEANFWAAIARTCKDSPAVFCYDLMNEPVVPGAKTDQWLVPIELAGFSYVQNIALDPTNRDRMQIARDWTAKMIAAIRKHDRRHMITIGLLPVSTDLVQAVGPQVDFVSVHVYPESRKVDEALATLNRFDVGKPIVIEETFPTSATIADFRDFLARCRPHAAGVIGFYWGQTPGELKPSPQLVDQQMLKWLELFQELHPAQRPAYFP
jgi:hypothetical protein